LLPAVLGGKEKRGGRMGGHPGDPPILRRKREGGGGKSLRRRGKKGGGKKEKKNALGPLSTTEKAAISPPLWGEGTSTAYRNAKRKRKVKEDLGVISLNNKKKERNPREPEVGVLGGL